MREIIITTESGNDLPPHLVEKYNIYIAPMYITMRDVCYADRSIPVQEIFDYYKETSKVPTTSAVNVHDFTYLFTKIRREHPGCVIFHLAYSAITTCSYRNAEIAAKEFEDIYFVDTKNVSSGATAFIAKACELIGQKKETVTDYQALADEIASLASDVHFSFLPGNLDYLKAGGRVSNAAYLGATLLRIKPLIELKDGQLIATKKYRGSTEKLVEKFMTDFVNDNNISREYLYMAATGNLSKEAEKLMYSTAKKLGFKGFELNPCGLVITCHSGPGSIGVGGWSVNRENN